MIVFELTNTEQNPVYKTLEVENAERQFSFMKSILVASLSMGRPFLSQHVIKAFNYHAITCLHISAGEYRPCDVHVGAHRPPPFFRVNALMDDFVNRINRHWEAADPVVLATHVLWRLNNIHPFINGNGRTARTAAYYVLCLRNGGLIRGSVTLPELLKRDRDEYCIHLQHAHDTFATTGEADISPLHQMVSRLLNEQINSAHPSEDTTQNADLSNAANTPSIDG